MTDINDTRTWPDETIVVRAGVNTLEELETSVRLGGAISVVSRPNLSFAALSSSIRPNEPPSHCDLFGLTAEQLDTILPKAEPNPVPKQDRWRGAGR